MNTTTSRSNRLSALALLVVGLSTLSACGEDIPCVPSEGCADVLSEDGGSSLAQHEGAAMHCTNPAGCDLYPPPPSDNDGGGSTSTSPYGTSPGYASVILRNTKPELRFVRFEVDVVTGWPLRTHSSLHSDVIPLQPGEQRVFKNAVRAPRGDRIMTMMTVYRDYINSPVDTSGRGWDMDILQNGVDCTLSTSQYAWPNEAMAECVAF